MFAITALSSMLVFNSMWYYTDGDAIGTIDDNEYFLLSEKELTAGDVIIVNSGGSNGVVDILIITTSSATQVRSALLA